MRLRLQAARRRASKPGVEPATIDQSSAAGAPGSGLDSAWARDWEAVRASGDIQFAPVPPPAPAQVPGWLKQLSEWLEALLGPLGRALGVSWPVLEKILLGLAVLVVAGLAVRLGGRLLAQRRARPAAPEPGWAPGRDEALSLLGDADRLAAAGDYAGAVHLLLRRSVGQIAAARPEWIVPASTAREIAALPRLPERARTAFAAIAARVERSRFALDALAAEDWAAARAAYADFALAELAA